MDNISQATSAIREAKGIVVISGAGMSTASGIPDFRSASGIYATNPEDILSKDSFFHKTKEFYDVYGKMISYKKNAQPNDGHKILAKWEAEGKDIRIITQNIDGLHQAAGNTKVLELHGTMNKHSCHKCKKEYQIEDIFDESGNVKNFKCECRGLIKPDVVLFGEMTKGLPEAISMVVDADLLIILGTSMQVYPVADLPIYFHGKIIIVNQTSTKYDDKAITFHEDISETLTQIDKCL